MEPEDREPTQAELDATEEPDEDAPTVEVEVEVDVPEEDPA